MPVNISPHKYKLKEDDKLVKYSEAAMLLQEKHNGCPGTNPQNFRQTIHQNRDFF